MTSNVERRDIATAALLFVGVIGLFSRTITFDFVIIDDPLWVPGQKVVERGLSWEGVRHAFTSVSDGNYVPVTWLSHMLVAEIGGVRPAAHHAANVALHATCTALFFMFLRVATGAGGPSLFAAALFAAHPLRVESVAWVAERKDVLSGVFWVLCLIVYLAYARRPSAWRYGAVAGTFAMGLLAKPILVTLPFVFLLLDVWPLDRAGLESAGAGRRLGRLAAEKLPLLGMSAVAGVGAILSQQEVGALGSLDAVPLAQRLWNIPGSYAVYLVQTIFSWNLAVYYPLMPQAGLQSWGMAGLAALILITAAALHSWRRRPYAIVGWLWFVGTLVPVIGLVQVGGQAHADRYTYIPHMGLFVAVVWCARHAAERLAWTVRPGRVIAAATVIACAGLTWRQSGFWRDSVELFRHALAVTGPNHFSEGNLGVALVEASEFGEAETHLRRAMALGPATYRDCHNMGTALLKLGRPGEAAYWYEEAIKRNATHAPSWVMLGDARLAEGEGERAAEAYREALQLGPETTAVRTNLGIALGMAGQHEDAEREFERVLSKDPGNVDALFNHGLLLVKRRAMVEAIERFEDVISRAPSRADAHYYLAVAQCWRGDMDSAIESLSRAIELDAALRNKARGDSLFMPLWQTSEFKRIVGQP